MNEKEQERLREQVSRPQPMTNTKLDDEDFGIDSAKKVTMMARANTHTEEDG